ncbi:MAG: VanZ family protein [Aureispira sp.]
MQSMTMMTRFRAFFEQYIRWIASSYVLILTVVSLWPRATFPAIPIPKEKSSGWLPKEGINFKIVDAPVVYRLENGKRRPYKSAEAFLTRPENKPFGTSYEEGGILLCDSVVLLLYPLGTKMPRPTVDKMVPFNKRPYQPLNRGKSLLKQDKIGHLLVYMGLALVLWLVLITSFSWSKWRIFGVVLLSGTFFGLMLELGQQFYSAGRDAEGADLVMNILGLLLGSGLSSRFLNKNKDTGNKKEQET